MKGLTKIFITILSVYHYLVVSTKRPIRVIVKGFTDAKFYVELSDSCLLFMALQDS